MWCCCFYLYLVEILGNFSKSEWTIHEKPWTCFSFHFLLLTAISFHSNATMKLFQIYWLIDDHWPREMLLVCRHSNLWCRLCIQRKHNNINCIHLKQSRRMPHKNNNMMTDVLIHISSAMSIQFCCCSVFFHMIGCGGVSILSFALTYFYQIQSRNEIKPKKISKENCNLWWHFCSINWILSSSLFDEEIPWKWNGNENANKMRCYFVNLFGMFHSNRKLTKNINIIASMEWFFGCTIFYQCFVAFIFLYRSQHTW